MGRHIEIIAGEQSSEVFTVTRGGVAVDITGAYCYLGVWRPSTNLQIFQLDNETGSGNSGIVLTTPASGIFTATFQRADTVSEATEGEDVEAEYQVWVRLDPTGADDDSGTTQEGRFTIKPQQVTIT